MDRNPLGVLYRATRTADGQSVLLWLFHPAHSDPDERDRLLDRFKALRGLGSRRFVPVIELGQEGAIAFLALEDPDTTTLRELIDQRQAAGEPLSLQEAAQLTNQALEVATQLHSIGSYCRALRPEYLYVKLRQVGPKGSNTVAETRFLGGPLWDLVDTSDLAEDEYHRGTGQYLAPELKGLDTPANARADVFSAGAIFYELLCGDPPSGTYQLPKSRRPDLPREIDTVTELALAVAPDDRYPTPSDFSAGIQRTFAASGDDDDHGGVSWVVWALSVAVVAAFALLVYDRTSVDPLAVAIEHDNKLRKEIYESHPKPPAAEVREILARHPENMVYIPPGPYLSGMLEQERVRNPNIVDRPATVEELPGYLIDVFEHPNLRNAKPTYKVTWKRASDMCEEQGKRLCSAAEMEKACRGQENYVYGYGDSWDPMFCGDGLDDIHPSGRLPECKSTWGVYDIAGNFREWTSTERGENRRLVMGGVAQDPEIGTRCSFTTDLSTSFTDNTIGFRCCRDVDAPPPPATDGD